VDIKVSSLSDLLIPEKAKEQFSFPCLILDPAEAVRQFIRLRQALPTVEMYYAIKSFSHPEMLERLYTDGCNFDIASSGEIDILAKIGVRGQACIHTHPIKTEQDILDSILFRCTTFVVDNEYELEKFLPFKNTVNILIRLGFQNKDVVVDLSKKYGCSPEVAESLILKAKELGINVIGLSFHVGSQCSNNEQHVNAIKVCCDIVKKYNLSVLDIGGGFPVDYVSIKKDFDIDTFCAPIRAELKKLSATRVIAEPGRFISAPSMTSYSRVVGKSKRGDAFWYYLDDGVYGSFSGMIYDHMTYPLEVFTSNNTGDRYTSVFAGPTCDSIDVVAEGVLLPELNIGDVLVGYNMGAYTRASATDFNCIKKAKIVVI